MQSQVLCSIKIQTICMYLLRSHNYIKQNNEKYNKSAVELLGYIFSAIIQHYLFAVLCFKYVSTFIVHISWRALLFVHLSCFHHDTPGEQLSPPLNPPPAKPAAWLELTSSLLAIIEDIFWHYSHCQLNIVKWYICL